MTHRFILWDFDGTLGRRRGGWSGALVDVARREAPWAGINAEKLRPYLQSGFPWHAPECAHTDLSPDEWWEELLPVFARALRGAGLPFAQARELAGLVRAEYLRLDAWECFPDSLPALDVLGECGWSHVLLTNHVPELPTILNWLRLTPYFSAVFNSADTGYEKPNPHAFRNALNWIVHGRRTGSLRESSAGLTVWVVGDSLSSDIIGAREAGLKAALVRRVEPGYNCCENLENLVEMLETSG